MYTYAYGNYIDQSEVYKYIDLNLPYSYWSLDNWQPGNLRAFAHRIANAARVNVIVGTIPDSGALLYGCAL